jgi:hypothetical protein
MLSIIVSLILLVYRRMIKKKQGGLRKNPLRVDDAQKEASFNKKKPRIPGLFISYY